MIVRTPKEIIDSYPNLGAFLSSAQGFDTAVKLMEEYHQQFEKIWCIKWDMFFGSTDVLQEGNLTLEEAIKLKEKLDSEFDEYVSYKIEKQ